MFQLSHHCDRPVVLATLKLFNGHASARFATEAKQEKQFRVLRIKPQTNTDVKRSKSKPYRWTQLTTTREKPKELEWSTVWPAARTFHPDVVNLPLRQGSMPKNKPQPVAYGNAELMKIPNFLHLTPPAVKKHCNVIKGFCTKWPEGLETDELCDKHFPIEIITSDYCFSAPTIREPLARIVSLRVKVASLNLGERAKDKFLRLVNYRYNRETDLVTLTADRCPVRKQNLDYVYYLLTALYHESWRVQPWEAEKGLVDMEEYDWEKNSSKTSLLALLSWPEESKEIDYANMPSVTEYKIAVEDMINKGEDEYAVNKYKDAVKAILNLQD